METFNHPPTHLIIYAMSFAGTCPFLISSKFVIKHFLKSRYSFLLLHHPFLPRACRYATEAATDGTSSPLSRQRNPSNPKLQSKNPPLSLPCHPPPSPPSSTTRTDSSLQTASRCMSEHPAYCRKQVSQLRRSNGMLPRGLPWVLSWHASWDSQRQRLPSRSCGECFNTICQYSLGRGSSCRSTERAETQGLWW